MIKARPWILLAIYVIISCSLLFQNNPYQHSLYLTSANKISTAIYNASNVVSSYFNLREINDELQRQNADLEQQILNLKDQIKTYREIEYMNSVSVDSSLSRYHFIIAHVINNSISHTHNYITIDKGELDGVKPDMGVIDQNGVVGKVNVVGPHSARLISLLNNNLRISCKVKGSQQIGSLVWDGDNHSTALLEELPRHATFNKGDTIVTSGYSTSFPEGVPVGIISDEIKEYDDNFYTLRIKLFTDFSSLSTIRIIIDDMAKEIRTVESKIDDE